MKIRLSNRLEHVADLVSAGVILADVGTDHGYIPLYLLQNQKIKEAIAMDIGKGPLSRAMENIIACGMQDQIKTRLSDGVAALTPGEVDSVVIAGMGGGLVIHILDSGEAVCRKTRELILQPQSELTEVRRYLDRNGYRIENEDMVLEDGKYYPMMRVVPASTAECSRETETEKQEKELEYRFGPLLLRHHHPVLKSYLMKQKMQYENLLEHLQSKEPAAAALERIRELETELRFTRLAIDRWEELDKDEM